MSADVDSIPLPEILWIEPDEPPHTDRFFVVVRCPLCSQTHRHDSRLDERRVFERVPHCLVRLDVEQVPYVIDLTQDLDIEGVDDDDATP